MRLMKDMDEQELKTYFNLLMEATKAITPPDVIGFMVVMFTDQGITQYASSIDPTTAPDALRELADRLERREMVER